MKDFILLTCFRGGGIWLLSSDLVDPETDEAILLGCLAEMLLLTGRGGVSLPLPKFSGYMTRPVHATCYMHVWF